jgi:hypothetical protein
MDRAFVFADDLAQLARAIERQMDDILKPDMSRRRRQDDHPGETPARRLRRFPGKVEPINRRARLAPRGQERSTQVFFRCSFIF